MIDASGFRFQDPLWLWAALLAPLVVAAAWLRERQGRAIVFPGVARLAGKPRGWRAAWSRRREDLATGYSSL